MTYHLIGLRERKDPKKGSSGSASAPPVLCGPETQDVAVFSAADDARCCAHPLPHHPARGTGKQQYDYSLCMVYFRKIVNKIKIGSDRNGHPVIYQSGYMAAYYDHENDDGTEKSSG